MYSGYVMEKFGAGVVIGLSGGYVVLALGILVVCYDKMGGIKNDRSGAKRGV